MAVSTSSPGQRLAVRAEDLVPFAPVDLGPASSRLRSAFKEVSGRRQRDIVRVLREQGDLAASGSGASDINLSLCLYVLSDYVAAGYYPIVSKGRCFLAPVTGGRGLPEARRRSALQRSYEVARLQALRSKGRGESLHADASRLVAMGYESRIVAARLEEQPPRLVLRNASDGSDERVLWRSVRSTWSMTPDASAPGREISLVAVSKDNPATPLGAIQFRNVVPEIRARDRWLGITTAGFETGLGYLAELARRGDEKARIRETTEVLECLLNNVRRESLDGLIEDKDVPRLRALAASERALFDSARKQGNSEAAKAHLARTKRADTAADLLRGISGLTQLLETGIEAAATDGGLRGEIDAGLRKIWHYHMGFVALEMSVCGAAPPFGPIRAGKLMAGIAGTHEALSYWGADRPLGSIASTVYDEAIRTELANPGPLLVMTSGLYPGHSAQYTRATSGASKWSKIGETVGYGSFHISRETVAAAHAVNEMHDGYRHVSHEFGEGASPRFRAIGRALSRLGLPDLRRHETQRPVYALPLVDDVPGVLLGWTRPDLRERPSVKDVTDAWWKRWVDVSSADLIGRSAGAPDLVDTLTALARQVDAGSV